MLRFSFFNEHFDDQTPYSKLCHKWSNKYLNIRFIMRFSSWNMIIIRRSEIRSQMYFINLRLLLLELMQMPLLSKQRTAAAVITIASAALYIQFKCSCHQSLTYWFICLSCCRCDMLKSASLEDLFQ